MSLSRSSFVVSQVNGYGSMVMDQWILSQIIEILDLNLMNSSYFIIQECTSTILHIHKYLTPPPHHI